MRTIVLIAHNLRSTHNVGSLLRTAEGLGVGRVYLTGYTPYPQVSNDTRLPHEALKTHAKIQKTALGAETMIAVEHHDDVLGLLKHLKKEGYQICALEQDDRAMNLSDFNAGSKVALIVGREVDGVEPEVLEMADAVIEIPMRGLKESFNVVQAAAMALYQLSYVD